MTPKLAVWGMVDGMVTPFMTKDLPLFCLTFLQISDLLAQPRPDGAEPGTRFLQFFAGGKRGFCRPRSKANGEAAAIDG